MKFTNTLSEGYGIFLGVVYEVYETMYKNLDYVRRRVMVVRLIGGKYIRGTAPIVPVKPGDIVMFRATLPADYKKTKPHNYMYPRKFQLIGVK